MVVFVFVNAVLMPIRLIPGSSHVKLSGLGYQFSARLPGNCLVNSCVLQVALLNPRESLGLIIGEVPLLSSLGFLLV